MSKRPTVVIFVLGIVMLISPLGLVISGVSPSIVSWLLYVMLAGGILLGYAMKRYFDSIRVTDRDIE